MQIKDLVKDVTKMSDEELHEHVRSIRHNKYVARPAAARRRADERKKVVRKQTTKAEKLIDKMTPEQRRELLKLLGASND